MVVTLYPTPFPDPLRISNPGKPKVFSSDHALFSIAGQAVLGEKKAHQNHLCMAFTLLSLAHLFILSYHTLGIQIG